MLFKILCCLGSKTQVEIFTVDEFLKKLETKQLRRDSGLFFYYTGKRVVIKNVTFDGLCEHIYPYILVVKEK